MDRYDRGWIRGYGRDYGRDFGMRRMRGYRGEPEWSPRFDRGAAPYGPPRGYSDQRMGAAWGRGYDRAVYGRGYPGPSEARRGYDRGYEGQPFIPETVYREHPEFDRPRHAMADPGTRPSYTRVYGEMDDGEIRSAVEESLARDRWIDPGVIQVRVQDQVVTLTGEVGDYLEARYAWDDAWDAMGVRGVINHLTVRLDESTAEHREPFVQEESPPKAKTKTTSKRKGK